MKKVFLALLLVPILAFAWEPTKPITVLIGNQPGSGNEVGFRAISAIVMRDNPKANFVIELKPGGDSVIAMNMLYEAKPDGVEAKPEFIVLGVHDNYSSGYR